MTRPAKLGRAITPSEAKVVRTAMRWFRQCNGWLYNTGSTTDRRERIVTSVKLADELEYACAANAVAMRKKT